MRSATSSAGAEALETVLGGVRGRERHVSVDRQRAIEAARALVKALALPLEAEVLRNDMDDQRWPIDVTLRTLNETFRHRPSLEKQRRQPLLRRVLLPVAEGGDYRRVSGACKNPSGNPVEYSRSHLAHRRPPDQNYAPERLPVIERRNLIACVAVSTAT